MPGSMASTPRRGSGPSRPRAGRRAHELRRGGRGSSRRSRPGRPGSCSRTPRRTSSRPRSGRPAGEVHLDPAVAGVVARRMRARVDARTPMAGSRASPRASAMCWPASLVACRTGRSPTPSGSPSARRAPTSRTSWPSSDSPAGPRPHCWPSSTAWTGRVTCGTRSNRRYDVGRAADAPAIVFVHGTWLTRSSWSPRSRTSPTTYRVIAMDLPGHGALGDRPFTVRARRRRARAGDRRGGRRTRGGRRVVARRVRRHGPRGAGPERVRGLVAGRRDAGAGRPSRPSYLALAWVGRPPGRTRPCPSRPVALRARYAPAIADPILADGVPAERRLGRAAGARRRAIHPAAGRVSGPGPDRQRRAGRPVPARCDRPSRGSLGTLAASGSGARATS